MRVSFHTSGVSVAEKDRLIEHCRECRGFGVIFFFFLLYFSLIFSPDAFAVCLGGWVPKGLLLPAYTSSSPVFLSFSCLEHAGLIIDTPQTCTLSPAQNMCHIRLLHGQNNAGKKNVESEYNFSSAHLSIPPHFNLRPSLSPCNVRRGRVHACCAVRVCALVRPSVVPAAPKRPLGAPSPRGEITCMAPDVLVEHLFVTYLPTGR